jgi:hypothetical protein
MLLLLRSKVLLACEVPPRALGTCLEVQGLRLQLVRLEHVLDHLSSLILFGILFEELFFLDIFRTLVSLLINDLSLDLLCPSMGEDSWILEQLFNSLCVSINAVLVLLLGH